MSEATPDQTNGIPTVRIFEDTGELHRAAVEHVAAGDPKEAAAEIVTAIFDKIAAGGGPPPPPSAPATPKRSNRTLIAIVLAAVMPGGALAAFYAMDDRSKANQEQVEELQEIRPVVEAHTRQLEEIGQELDDLGESVDKATTAQGEVVDAINELRAESLDELKADLKEARRELRNR